LPEHIPVLPGELKVIETFLAVVLAEFLEPTSVEAEKGGNRECEAGRGIVE
jgi:hypothetical protein